MRRVERYWNERFSLQEGIVHHSTQNLTISKDFLIGARTKSAFGDALSSHKIIEVGCGTGELSVLIRHIYKTRLMYATDFSREAVKTAQSRHVGVNFWVYDVLNDPPCGEFDLAIASNVIEHFRNPYAVVDKMLILAPLVIVLIPYRQPVMDGYDDEGGAGHVYEFSKKTFKRYHVVDSFIFNTEGWQHRSGKEKPQQLAVLLSAKE